MLSILLSGSILCNFSSLFKEKDKKRPFVSNNEYGRLSSRAGSAIVSLGNYMINQNRELVVPEVSESELRLNLEKLAAEERAEFLEKELAKKDTNIKSLLSSLKTAISESTQLCMDLKERR